MSASALYDAMLLAAMAGSLLGLLAIAAVEYIRAWISRRDLANEFLLRVAMDDAKRLGYLSEEA